MLEHFANLHEYAWLPYLAWMKQVNAGGLERFSGLATAATSGIAEGKDGSTAEIEEDAVTMLLA